MAQDINILINSLRARGMPEDVIQQKLNQMGVSQQPQKGFLRKVGENLFETAVGLPKTVFQAGKTVGDEFALRNLEKQLQQVRQEPLTEDRVRREEEIANRMQQITQPSSLGFNQEELEFVSQGGNVERGLRGGFVGGKKGAGTASFFVPGGGGAATTALGRVGTAAGRGLLSGALYGVAQSPEGMYDQGAYEALKQTAGQGVLGGVTGGITGAAIQGTGEVINGIRSLFTKGVGKAQQAASNKAAMGINKATPSQHAKAVETLGFDVNDLTKKHVPAGSSYDDLLGSVSEKGRGGLFKSKLTEAEKRIRMVMKMSGRGKSAQKVSVDDFVNELNKELRLLKKVPGNEGNVKALQKFIDETKKLYRGGITPQKMLDIKRAADSKFGSAVVDETTGSVAAQGQKILANASRSKLKQLFPGVKDALDLQSEILTLRPIINRARSINLTQGSEIRLGSMGSITDVINPLKLTDRAMQKPEFASRFLKPSVGGVTPQITQGAISPTAQNVVSRVSPLLSTAGVMAGQETMPSTQQLQMQQQPRIQQQSGLTQGNYEYDESTGTLRVKRQGAGTQQDYSDPNYIYQLMVADLQQTGGKNRTALNQLFQDAMLLREMSGTGGINVGKVTAQNYTNAKVGRDSLTALEGMLYRPDGSLNSELVIALNTPGEPSGEARQAMAHLWNMADAMLRLRTGAQANPSEIAKQAKALQPKIGDLMFGGKNTIEARMGVYRNNFDTIVTLAEQGGIDLDGGVPTTPSTNLGY